MTGEEHLLWQQLWLTDLQKYMAHIVVERENSQEEKPPHDYIEPIKSLWQDTGVKKAIAKGNKYALHDNLA